MTIKNKEQLPESVKKNAVIYCRKSAEEEQRGTITSCEMQEKECRVAFDRFTGEKSVSAPNEEWMIGEIYVDEGESGKNTRRPAFQRLLRDVEAGGVDALFAYKLDRVSRSVFDTLTLLREVLNVLDAYPNRKRVELKLTKEHFDTTTPQGRFTLNMLASVAELERETIVARIVDIIESKRDKGIWPGAPSPVGYKNVNKFLIIDEDERKIIEYIYSEAAKDEPISKIRLDLEERIKAGEFKVNSEPKHFTSERIRDVIRNPVYKGYIRAKNNEGVHKGIHEPIVTEELWDGAVAKLNARGKPRERQERHDWLLKGKIRCKACDRSMAPKVSKGRKELDCFYYCCTVPNDVKCKGYQKSVCKWAIEELVLSETRTILETPEKFKKLSPYLEKFAKNYVSTLEYLKNYSIAWDAISLAAREEVARGFVKNVFIDKGNVTIVFSTIGLRKLMPDEFKGEGAECTHEIVIKGQFIKRGGGQKQFFQPEDLESEYAPKTDPKVVKGLRRVQKWADWTIKEQVTAEQIAEREGMCKDSVLRYFNGFGMLSPKVEAAIENETLSPKFCLSDFTRRKFPKKDWAEQEAFFGVE
jgi:DNA invertase Pin-like site-specific DNA recombinase